MIASKSRTDASNAERRRQKCRQYAVRGRMSILLGVVVAMLLVVLAGILWSWDDVEANDNRDNKKRVQHRDGAGEEAKRNEVESVEGGRAKAVKSEEERERERRKKMFGRMSVDEKIAYLREQIRDMPVPDAPEGRLYGTALEQTMDWIFTCEVGNPPPLLPPMSLFDQMHLAEILVSDNPVLDTNDEREFESKEMMKVAKDEFIKFLKDGGNPDEFLTYYHGQLVAAHEEWKLAREAIYNAVRTEPEIALEFARQVNERLAEKGIRQVVVPQKMLEAFGVEVEE